MNKELVVTRFAPSPTGELHIGGARTALFNYLFAKSLGGKFLLRIEDTDQERFVEGATERIVESLNWLGICPDNSDKLVVQSQRLSVYKKAALKLVEEDKAYICTCSKERLAEVRQKQIDAGKAPMYDGYCRDKKYDATSLKEGGYTIRMKMPREGQVVVEDLIRGKVTFDLSLFDDQVLIKSDGYPTYHLASVVDDNEMEVTHVLRAEEWLPSTPKHLVLYQMLGYESPKFAHLSMILAPDKTKLSKRHGAVSVLEFQKDGYLAEAIVNFIALLGWNPKNEQEIFSLKELEENFKISNVNKSAAVFNIDKLNFLNEHYLREYLANNRNCIKTILCGFGLEEPTEAELDLLGRGGFKTVGEAVEYILKLRQDPNYSSDILIFKKSDKDKTRSGLSLVFTSLESTSESDWQIDKLQQKLTEVAQKDNLANGDVFWPTRVALSGEEKSPSPTELLMALGKTESLKRIKKALDIL